MQSSKEQQEEIRKPSSATNAKKQRKITEWERLEISSRELEIPREHFGESNGTPLQYFCLENPMDGGAWQAAVHGVSKSRARLSNFTFTFTFMHWRRKWQPTPVFLPGESQGWGSLVGCRLWGRTESEMTEATQQQQQPIKEEKKLHNFQQTWGNCHFQMTVYVKCTEKQQNQ